MCYRSVEARETSSNRGDHSKSFYRRSSVSGRNYHFKCSPLLTWAHLLARRTTSRSVALHRVVFSGFRGRLMASARKWGLLFSLLASISHLFVLRSVAVSLSVARVSLRSRIRSSFLFSFPLRSTLTRIHTHVYSHSNQLRRLFFGPRHASFASLRGLSCGRRSPRGPYSREHYYFSALFAYQTALHHGGQHMHPSRQTCRWSTRCQSASGAHGLIINYCLFGGSYRLPAIYYTVQGLTPYFNIRTHPRLRIILPLPPLRLNSRKMINLEVWFTLSLQIYGDIYRPLNNPPRRRSN